jgi:hypothetical protein
VTGSVLTVTSAGPSGLVESVAAAPPGATPAIKGSGGLSATGTVVRDSGLATVLLLARVGRQVTVLERDAAEPVGEAEELWNDWHRPGVSQFRLPHVMHGRRRRPMERELPEVERLDGCGSARSTCCPRRSPEGHVRAMTIYPDGTPTRAQLLAAMHNDEQP